MKKQIRKNVFETNSSTSHTLTLRYCDDNNETNLIPRNSVFEFSNYLYIENKLGNADYETIHIATEQDKLAVCMALCLNMYENETKTYYFNYNDLAKEEGKTLNEYLKDKPYFKELYQVIKDVCDTELVIESICNLDSLNDDMAFEPLIDDCKCHLDETANFYDFIRHVIFSEYEIIDEVVPM